MKGTFFGVGVGPGDPELLTLKAINAIKNADILAIPKQAKESGSLALSIAKDYVNENSEILELVFPMTFDKSDLKSSWNAAYETVSKRLDEGRDVALITLGDVSVYSTCMYVINELKKNGYAVKIIPGIPSFCASAAAAGVSLCEGSESLMVIPSVRNIEKVKDAVEEFDNVVLMKVSGNIKDVFNVLEEKGLQENAATISKCSFPDERVIYGADAANEDLSYFTTMIIKKNWL